MNARRFDPDAVLKKARRLYERGKVQAAFLENDERFFPVRIGLGKLSEKAIRSDFDRVRREAEALERSGLPLERRRFRFASIGEQRLPVAVVFETRERLLEALGLTETFERFMRESGLLLAAFPALRPLLIEKPLLIESVSGDWERLVAVCRFLVSHPRPGIYLRQLPVEGVDTKFVESRRKVLDLLLTHLLDATAFDAEITSLASGGFERKYGFRTPQPMIRFRLLDETCAIAGQSDLALPADAFATLAPEGVETVFVVENKATFLAFPPHPRAMVIFGSGYGAHELKAAAWLAGKRLYYWGDLDTHGFAILSQFRGTFPRTRSLMMDAQTLERFVSLAVEEPAGRRFEAEAPGLTPEETDVFERMRREGLRLEQERIPFEYVEKTVTGARTR